MSGITKRCKQLSQTGFAYMGEETRRSNGQVKHLPKTEDINCTVLFYAAGTTN